MEAPQLARGGQFLTFTLDGERYAVEISKVREVLELGAVNRVPRTPAYVRGMINLRGNIVPVIDLRLKLGMSRTERTVDTCIVITEVALEGEPVVLGALADTVQEVIELEDGAISPPPRMGTQVDTRFIRGVGKREGQFLVILDIDRVLSAEEIEAMSTLPLAAMGSGGSSAEQGGASA